MFMGQGEKESVCLSVWSVLYILSVCLSGLFVVCLCVSASVSLSICSSVHPSPGWLSACLSVHQQSVLINSDNVIVDMPASTLWNHVELLGTQSRSKAILQSNQRPDQSSSDTQYTVISTVWSYVVAMLVFQQWKEDSGLEQHWCTVFLVICILLNFILFIW